MRKYVDAQELRDLYEQVRATGKIHTRKDFAELAGIPASNISSFMSGYTPLTEQKLQNIRNAIIASGIFGSQIIEENNGTAIVDNGDMGDNAQKNLQQQSDPRWFDLVAEKDKQIDRLLGIIEKMQK